MTTFIVGSTPEVPAEPKPAASKAAGHLKDHPMNDGISGRLTVSGGEALEAKLHQLVRKASRAILGFVPKENLKLLVLGGSHGRGEGGMRVDCEGEHAAGALDLTLFTKGLNSAARTHLAAKINSHLDTLRRRSRTGIDLSVVDARRMEREPARLRWYDLRNGFKLLAGDPGFLAASARFEAKDIDPRDFADLVMGRGAGLILNDIVRAQGPLTGERRDLVLKNAARAVIAYGDALLFHQGAYHWSYLKRRARMTATSIKVSDEFRSLYDWAMNYRFHGDAISAARLMTVIENGQGRRAMSALHLELERLRFGGRPMVWRGHLRASLKRELEGLTSSLQGLARGALTLVRGRVKLASAPYSVRMALGVSGEEGAARALFPLLAYGHVDAEEADLARRLLGVKKLGSIEAKAAWLRMWSRSFDPDFASTLRRLELSARPAA